jgi:hypothetical protein
MDLRTYKSFGSLPPFNWPTSCHMTKKMSSWKMVLIADIIAQSVLVINILLLGNIDSSVL